MLATDSAPLSPATPPLLRVSFLPPPLGPEPGWGRGVLWVVLLRPPRYRRRTGKKAVLIAPLWTELFQKRSEVQCQ